MTKQNRSCATCKYENDNENELFCQSNSRCRGYEMESWEPKEGANKYFLDDEEVVLPEIGPPGKPTGNYELLGRSIGALVDEKQLAYGDSFGKSGAMLKVLYPNGVTVDQYDDMLCLVRILDKLFRVANKKDAFSESPYSDIVGYGLLGLAKDKDKEDML